VATIAPAFGGINLEDISAPRCFAVEERLRDRLDIPVIHDDQHGTATVVLAAMINALRVVGKQLETARVVVVGAGAAGTAVTRLLLAAGAKDVIVWAPVGVLHPNLNGQLPEHKRWLANHTNPRGIEGGLGEALSRADAVIGVSAPNVLSRKLIKRMASDPIVFALANPQPEIDPDEIADFAAVIATGSSEYPNQVNNALAFPGLFRGVLDAPAAKLDNAAFVAIAQALAELTTAVAATCLLPDIFDSRVVPAVAAAVQLANAPQSARPS
jgi:malate dehydrogenase (oxaloacetate-decarboxylating)